MNDRPPRGQVKAPPRVWIALTVLVLLAAGFLVLAWNVICVMMGIG